MRNSVPTFPLAVGQRVAEAMETFTDTIRVCYEEELGRGPTVDELNKTHLGSFYQDKVDSAHVFLPRGGTDEEEE